MYTPPPFVIFMYCFVCVCVCAAVFRFYCKRAEAADCSDVRMEL
jgi:hypothetical protein